MVAQEARTVPVPASRLCLNGAPPVSRATDTLTATGALRYLANVMTSPEVGDEPLPLQ